VGTDKAGTTGPTGRVDPSLPQVFGRYLLVQRLSRGGMGEIFLAKHGLAGFEKLAVIKKVLPHLAADAQFISRFVDEAQVAIKLQHVNVAQVFEVGRVADEYFLALEYVEGRDLRRTIGILNHKKQRLPVDLALFIGRELANGLAYAHRRTTSDGAAMNLVHCDISPPNVLVSFEGETKVIDFGIAKSAMRGTATDPKMGFGKFGYMAPEQLIRGGVVDHRTDIYAAGVVLFELLTGQRLYEAGPEPDYRALAKKVAKGEHTLPSEVDRSLAPYDDLVATALRPRSEDRYQTAAEFRDAIQQALVAVNPTISTDQLGSYMRDLFADEMTAQRELHDRIAKAHLADFQEQFHTQTISTVSFALAQLPQPPAVVAIPPRLPSGSSGEMGAVRPSPALDTMAPPTSAMGRPADLDELPLADGTGISVLARPTRYLNKVVVAAVAGIAVAAVVAFAMTRKGKTDPKPPEPPPTKMATSKVTFEPIEAPPPPKHVDPPPVEVEIKPALKVDPPVKKAPPIHKRPEIHKDPTTTTTKPELTRELVGAKFKQTSRLYEAYKAKNGARLEQDWNNLATFIQFKMTEDNLDDAVHRMDAFAAKLRE
jgi:serine/threonine-protein kinase